ncbi:hypothetical protein [Virgibacillus litoralis]|uniref:Type II secretory pathway component PulM n=1 Tax=Virgibacillus litoralis TaxID=578221 RepID=A0ABS4HA63_9BACI|nr:hypothetical protein [Virgibacillus litoralis]MBP1947758.1 type II secretory pathway component PulM [Virgibacillus litoralis]
MDISNIGVIIIIVIAYLPVIYNMQKRIRKLEDEVNEMRKRM